MVKAVLKKYRTNNRCGFEREKFILCCNGTRQFALVIHKNCVSFEMFYFSVYEKGNKRIRVFAIYHKMNLIGDSQLLFENTQKCCVDALLLQY